MSIQFDGTELQNVTYIPQYVKHETAPDRILGALPLTSDDGEILVTDRRGVKVITLRGTLIASTSNNLDVAIDSFKELLSRPQKNLDISWNGTTRRYVATCTNHSFDRDHYNTNALPWTAEFTIFSGEGKDTTTTTALVPTTLATGTPVASSFPLSGSKPPKPVITITGNVFWADTQGIEYKNVDTGEKIVITLPDPISVTGVFVINCLEKKVTYNGTETRFYGVFPNFKIGTNNVQISAGALVNQTSGETSPGVAVALNATTDVYAQSFSVPYTDNTFSGIEIYAYKEGTPGTMTIRIEKDNGNAPSGTLVHANATLTIASGSFGLSGAYIRAYFANFFTLNANTKYWLVIKAAATLDASNLYRIGIAGSYSKGSAKESTNSGATYTSLVTSPSCISFKILYGGEANSSNIEHSVIYTKTYL